jgi:starvation-inducible DNA-binding protein
MATEMLARPGVPTQGTATTDALGRLLADTYVLYVKTHGYHWNVTGPRFAQLHAMFETQYLELFAAVDEIAERMRALGTMAPGAQRQFLALTTLIEQDDSVPDASEMVRQLADDHGSLIATATTALKAAEAAGDAPTIDLVTRRLAIHEKTRWMLRASL